MKKSTKTFLKDSNKELIAFKLIAVDDYEYVYGTVDDEFILVRKDLVNENEDFNNLVKEVW